MDQHGISKLDLKRQNRMQILKLLKQKGPISRIDIASTLQITRAAVTIITNEMIAQGIIAEIGELKTETVKASRGRKKILIDINYNYKFAVGVTLETSILSIGLCTLNGSVLDKRVIGTDAFSDGKDVYLFIKNALEEILEYNCLNADRIIGLGFGIVSDMFDFMNVTTDNQIFDFSSVISEMSQITSIPCVADNWVKGSAMANIDFEKELDPDRQNIGFLQYGPKYNYVVANLNEPLNSYDNRTTFVNNIIVNTYSDFQLDNNTIKGTVLSELTPLAIVKKITPIYSKNKTPYLFDLTDGNTKKITIAKVIESVKNGDTALEEIFDKLCLLISILINNLIYATNPQKLVLHDFEIAEKDFPYFKHKIELVTSKEVSDRLKLSIIDKKKRFLGGAAIAIRAFFYRKGGI